MQTIKIEAGEIKVQPTCKICQKAVKREDLKFFTKKINGVTKYTLSACGCIHDQHLVNEVHLIDVKKIWQDCVNYGIFLAENEIDEHMENLRAQLEATFQKAS